MADPKPSTSDILAKIRAAKAAEGSAPNTPPAEAAAPPSAVPPEATAASAEASASAAPAAKPKSTADIMAAIKKGPGGAAAAAPAPAGDKPKSTADILAAARSGGATKPAGDKSAGTSNILASIRGGGAGAPAAPAAGGAAPKAVAPKVAAPAAGDRPSVQEMLKAVKRAEAAESGAPAVAVATAPAKPKLPAKAAPGKAGGKAGAEVTRRSVPAALVVALMTPYYLGMSVLAAIGGIWTLAMARFMMPNTVLELPSKFKIGPESDYPFGKVSEKYKASRGVWIVNTDFEGAPAIYALSSVCTHLGCTPSWLEAEQKFKCPCHGSGFYITGINFEGPAPRPLERVGLSLTPDGQLEVDKSRKFQEELGQWQDPKSFVRVV